ncbi:MAG: hypothetical protein ACHQ5A_07140 [Opitutales bacterium]
MKLHPGRAARCGLAWLALTGVCLGGGAEARAATNPSAPATPPPLLPVADFARAPQYINMQISPDGSCVGYQVLEEGGSGFSFLSLADMKIVGIFWGSRGEYALNGVYDYQWSGSKRVIIETFRGLGIADRDTKWYNGIGSESGITHLQADRLDIDGILLDDRQQPIELHVLHHSDVSGLEYRPDVYRLNIGNGSYNLLEKNPGNVAQWRADWDGNIRFGLITDGVETSMIYRTVPGGSWSTPLAFGEVGAGCSIAGLDADNRTLFVFKPSPLGRLALYGFDLQTRQFSEPLFQHDRYDVTTAVFYPKERRLLGVGYDTDLPRHYWFQPELARLQKELDAAAPGMVNEFVSFDREMRSNIPGMPCGTGSRCLGT